MLNCSGGLEPIAVRRAGADIPVEAGEVGLRQHYVLYGLSTLSKILDELSWRSVSSNKCG